MKNLVILSALFTSFTALACPNVEETIARYKVGEQTSREVAAATLCQLDQLGPQHLCQSRLGLARDLLAASQLEHNIGLITDGELEAAKDKPARAVADCSKK